MQAEQIKDVSIIVGVGLVLLWIFHIYVYKPTEAQDLTALAHLRWKTTALLQYLNAKYPDHPVTKNLQARLSFDHVSTMSKAKMSIGYTLNKNYITICTKNTDGSEGNDDAEFYVILHEISHVATNESQHTPLFWQNFHWLLRIANTDLHLFDIPLSDDRNVELCGQVVNMEDGVDN